MEQTVEFDTPTPQTRNGHDFDLYPLKGSYPVMYNAGTLTGPGIKLFFEGRLQPDDMQQGFQQYDPEFKGKVSINAFTAYVLGLYYGAFSNGKDKGDIRYSSNLVNDTRTDILQMSYFVNQERRTLAIGNYMQDISPAVKALNRGSSYTKIIVAYVPELKATVGIHLGATAEAGFVKGIAKAYGQEEWKTKLYGMSDIENEIWVFKFNGEFEGPVVFSAKDAKRVPATIPATPKADKVYFQPVIQAGVIRSDNPRYKDTFAHVSALRNEFSDYIASEQAYLKGLLDKKNGTLPVEEMVEAPDGYPDITDFRELSGGVNTNIRPNQARTEDGFDWNSEYAPQTAGTPLDDLAELF